MLHPQPLLSIPPLSPLLLPQSLPPLSPLPPLPSQSNPDLTSPVSQTGKPSVTGPDKLSSSSDVAPGSKTISDFTSDNRRQAHDNLELTLTKRISITAHAKALVLQDTHQIGIPSARIKEDSCSELSSPRSSHRRHLSPSTISSVLTDEDSTWQKTKTTLQLPEIAYTTSNPSIKVLDRIFTPTSDFAESLTLVRSQINSSRPSIDPTSCGSLKQSISNSPPPDRSSQTLTYDPKKLHHSKFPWEDQDRQGLSASTESPLFIQSLKEMGVHDNMPLETSRREELEGLWNCANGFKARTGKGQRYCLKMTYAAAENPIYILSSTTQAFYSFRFTKTLTSDQMSLMRYDPKKEASVSILGFSKAEKGVEVICTKLQEGMNPLPPKDGLVALLYPKAASNKFIEQATKISHANQDKIVATAERECGRLIWDEDSGNYYLAHPALRTPFLVIHAIMPASSSVKYILEHADLPADIVTLTCDSTGGGYLEVDTASAAKVSCSYIIDVAVSAIILVASIQEKTRKPVALEPLSPINSNTNDNNSEKSILESPREESRRNSEVEQPETKKIDAKIQDFTLDLEGQTSMKHGIMKRTTLAVAAIWNQARKHLENILKFFLKLMGY
ncbi:Bgt-5463 [Blumeria graminis f. sp. tritici]|uniref:Bgt-5463 n=2 Tax=Blumeria graminis f. sp. tritici TaxID=62690 RepID=A0A9X9MFI4_BLUGR|nr:hypothetical protein BGT96224_5463 [Blumeria graminis f. sp. tritici 96224]VDB84090.1 Bgt-5463 [Blumeria graminis f. sp. tritici]